jgi:1-acyl-sn-glycerol-3-phosphate acyltransferase
MRWLAYHYLMLRGWSIDGGIPDERRFVMIGGPHTSNWDFVVFLGVIHYLAIQPKVLGKHTLVKGPFGKLMRRWGVIPVRRDVPENTVEKVRETFAANDEMMLVIAPEGTRARSDHWRSGFYKIAVGSGVPLVMAAIDGPTKRIKISEALELSGDVRLDMDSIRDFFDGWMGITPANKTPVRLRDEAVPEDEG